MWNEKFGLMKTLIFEIMFEVIKIGLYSCRVSHFSFEIFGFVWYEDDLQLGKFTCITYSKTLKALVLNFRTALRSVTRMYSAHSGIGWKRKLTLIITLILTLKLFLKFTPSKPSSPILLRLIHKICGINVG